MMRMVVRTGNYSCLLDLYYGRDLLYLFMFVSLGRYNYVTSMVKRYYLPSPCRQKKKLVGR
jgi:hypothetical protein